MNLHFPTPKSGLHRSLRVLSLLLLQHALVPAGSVNARSRLPGNQDGDAVDTKSYPYLKIAGSLPLRFSAAPEVAVSPPRAPIAPAASLQPVSTSPAEPASNPAPPAPTLNSELKTPPREQPAAPAAAPNDKPVLSILPDDTHSPSRAEDFLPFFQFPAGGNVTVVVPASAAKPPAPGQLPASSATYQQR